MSESSLSENSLTETETENELKRKKGRPKKDKEIIAEIEKKKRGRKKKEVEIVEVKQKKKRGRKATIKFFSSSIRKQIPLSSSIYDNNHILHIDADENIQETKNIDVENWEENPYVKELMDNDKDILLDYIDKNTNESTTLRELYESRIKNREKQDELLVNNLNIIHSITDNKIQKESKKENDKNKKSYIFLEKFVENREWLEQTDICCWHCCHKFNNVPIGLPIKYDSNINKFRVKGIFCSFACMVAYNENGSSNIIKFFYKKLTGKFDVYEKLEKAPSRYLLEMFGGPLTIEEFRNSTKEQVIYKMIEYPMFISRDYVEKIDLSNIKNANSNIFDESNNNKKVITLDTTKITEAKERLDKKSNIKPTTLDDFLNG